MKSPSQRRMNVTNRPRLGLPRCQRRDFNFRMAQQDADQLQRRVTGSTENGDANHEFERPILYKLASRDCSCDSGNSPCHERGFLCRLRRKTSAILMGFTFMLDILYDNGPCLVVNKQPGILTQAPAGIDSLEIQVKAFYREREQKEGNIYLGLPHRLDRPVSGAIVFARHVRAAQRLASQFENRTVTKVYWAVVEGDVQPDEGNWTDYLHKRHGMAQSIVVPEGDPRGKLAVMRYRVLGRMDGVGTWLEVELETGRTHQIRIQCASRGNAVVGDTQYGS